MLTAPRGGSDDTLDVRQNDKLIHEKKVPSTAATYFTEGKKKSSFIRLSKQSRMFAAAS